MMVLSDIVKRCMRLVRDTQSRVWSYAAPIVVAATAILYSVGGEVDSQAYAEHRQWSTPAQVVNARASALIEEDLTHNALSLLYGCTNPAACNFDFYTDCIDLSQLENEWGGPCGYLDDGSCVFPGCTDHQACNFNASDGCDDGSCIYPDNLGVCGGTCFGSDDDGDFICDDIDGCTDLEACNFDDTANSPCEYLDAVGVCGGDCWDDIDGDFICDDADFCTDLDACNYNDPANASCLYANSIFQCGDVCFDPKLEDELSLQGNVVSGTLQSSVDGPAQGQITLEVDNLVYGPFSTTVIAPTPFTIPVLNGVCNATQFTLLWEHAFCFNALTVLYEGYVHPDGPTTAGGIDCSGNCLEGVDSNEDGICDFLQTGCREPSACNYDDSALFGGPCTYPEWGFDCAGIYGAAYCGPGTIWDSEALQCLPVEDSCASDLDGSGAVGLNDLLQLLSDYALPCPQ